MFPTDLKYLTTIKVPQHTGAVVHGGIRIGVSRREDLEFVKNVVSSYISSGSPELKSNPFNCLLYKAACHPILLNDNIAFADYYVEMTLLVSLQRPTSPRSDCTSCNLSMSAESNDFSKALSLAIPHIDNQEFGSKMTDCFIRDMGPERMREIRGIYCEYFLGYGHDQSSHFAPYES
jgi:hypothetical protein